MKRYFVLVSLVMFATMLIGQNRYQDIVYLKNGNIIRGIIIEQVPNKSIKIKTEDNNVFVFEIDEIEKIAKEKIGSKLYAGLSVGTSIPLGDFADEMNGMAKTGFQVNVINLGYLFSENFGISATWLAASNPNIIEEIDPWIYGDILIGPLLSFSISNRLAWDLRPMIGYSITSLPDIGRGTDKAFSFAYDIGTLIRIGINKDVSILLTADYLSSKAKFKVYDFEQNIETLSLGLGLALYGTPR
jgi:hypothetical protein